MKSVRILHCKFATTLPLLVCFLSPRYWILFSYNGLHPGGESAFFPQAFPGRNGRGGKAT